MKKLIFYIRRTFHVSNINAKMILLQILCNCNVHQISDNKERGKKIQKIVHLLNSYFECVVKSSESDNFHISHNMKNENHIKTLNQLAQRI